MTLKCLDVGASKQNFQKQCKHQLPSTCYEQTYGISPLAFSCSLKIYQMVFKNVAIRYITIMLTALFHSNTKHTDKQ